MQTRSNTQSIASNTGTVLQTSAVPTQQTNTVPPDYDRWIENSINDILALPLYESLKLSNTAKKDIKGYIQQNLTAIPQRLTITNIEEIFDMYKKGLTYEDEYYPDNEALNIYGFNTYFLEPLVARSPLYNLYINLFETKNTNESWITRSNVVNFFFPIEFEISDLISSTGTVGEKKINSNLSPHPLKLTDNLYETYINYNNRNSNGSYNNKKIDSTYYINRSYTFSLLGEMFGQISNRNQPTVFGQLKNMFIGQDAADSIFNKIESYLVRAYLSSTSKFKDVHFNYFISILKNKCELVDNYPPTPNLIEYGFDNGCIKKIKLLLMFDNIHDFGKNRGDNNNPSDYYHTSNFKRVCAANTPQDDNDFCFINYILKNHITPLSQEILGRNMLFNFKDWEITKDTTTKLIDSVFSNNWEFELLKKLGSKLNYIGTYDFHVTDANNTFIRTILLPTLPQPPGNVGDIVNDTMSPNDTKLLRRILNFKENNNKFFYHKKLLNSIFDGYSGSTPKDPDPATYDVYNNQNLNIPFPYNNPNNTENIMYTSYRDQTLKKHVIRNFPNRFGIGGTDFRNGTVTVTGTYDRADNVIIKPNGTSNANIDHLTTVAKRAKELLNGDKRNHPLNVNMLFADNISFFITLKALGDFTQLLEAKIRNAIFITQDSMQFIIGAFIGTKMLKVGSDGKIYYANMDPPTQQQVLPPPPPQQQVLPPPPPPQQQVLLPRRQVLPPPSPRRPVLRTPPRASPPTPRRSTRISSQKKQRT